MTAGSTSLPATVAELNLRIPEQEQLPLHDEGDLDKQMHEGSILRGIQGMCQGLVIAMT